jgi:hypothetical protein
MRQYVADDFAKYKNAQSYIIFGLYCTNNCKGYIDWVQDMKRLTSAAYQLAVVNIDIHKSLIDNMQT